jgi:hypothetical protein
MKIHLKISLNLLFLERRKKFKLNGILQKEIFEFANDILKHFKEKYFESCKSIFNEIFEI